MVRVSQNWVIVYGLSVVYVNYIPIHLGCSLGKQLSSGVYVFIYSKYNSISNMYTCNITWILQHACMWSYKYVAHYVFMCQSGNKLTMSYSYLGSVYSGVWYSMVSSWALSSISSFWAADWGSTLFETCCSSVVLCWGSTPELSTWLVFLFLLQQAHKHPHLKMVGRNKHTWHTCKFVL